MCKHCEGLESEIAAATHLVMGHAAAALQRKIAENGVTLRRDLTADDLALRVEMDPTTLAEMFPGAWPAAERRDPPV